jgi:hypothetical protein
MWKYYLVGRAQQFNRSSSPRAISRVPTGGTYTRMGATETRWNLGRFDFSRFFVFLFFLDFFFETLMNHSADVIQIRVFAELREWFNEPKNDWIRLRRARYRPARPVEPLQHIRPFVRGHNRRGQKRWTGPRRSENSRASPNLLELWRPVLASHASPSTQLAQETIFFRDVKQPKSGCYLYCNKVCGSSVIFEAGNFWVTALTDHRDTLRHGLYWASQHIPRPWSSQPTQDGMLRGHEIINCDC